MEDFHNHGKMVRGLNPSFIVLIPKKEEVVELQDYRRISLIRSIYKIISKVLSMRLQVGRDKNFVSHLQFENDTLFLGKASEENIRFLKQFLILMKLVSGLKVNRDKCSLYGLNMEEGRIEEFASILGYRIGRFPFVYLGVKVGSSHMKVSDWEYVVRKITNRLRRWEGLKISIAGRLTLVNAVLSALPVYFPIVLLKLS
ncbi:hypothetical protein ACS0TY_024671 [Phlomoides rotata]